MSKYKYALQIQHVKEYHRHWHAPCSIQFQQNDKSSNYKTTLNGRLL